MVLNATLFWKMIPLSIHLHVCPFIQNEHAFKLGIWYIIQSTGYVWQHILMIFLHNDEIFFQQSINMNVFL